MWAARGYRGGRRWSGWAALLIGAASGPQAAASGFHAPYTIPDTATAVLGVLLAVAVLATAGQDSQTGNHPPNAVRHQQASHPMTRHSQAGPGPARSTMQRAATPAEPPRPAGRTPGRCSDRHQPGHSRRHRVHPPAAPGPWDAPGCRSPTWFCCVHGLATSPTRRCSPGARLQMPPRHCEITHFLWVPCTASRSSSSRCGGLAPCGQAVAWPAVGPGPAAVPSQPVEPAISPIRVSSKWREHRQRVTARGPRRRCSNGGH